MFNIITISISFTDHEHTILQKRFKKQHHLKPTVELHWEKEAVHFLTLLRLALFLVALKKAIGSLSSSTA